jgi:RNA polymerase sigma-70 factor (ECF subfamily)
MTDWRAVATRALDDARHGDIDRLAAHLAALDLDDVPEHVGDVALAFAAACGEPSAQVELHRRVVHAAHATLPGAGYAQHIIDDTVGELALTLLGDHTKPSPLLTYRGQSSLAGWLRTLAVRTAMRLAQASRREAPASDTDTSLLLDHVTTSDLTRDLYRAELRTVVRRAFATAIAALSYFDRELLAAFIVQAKSLDDIAKAHDVHRATAARWLARARAALDRELSKELERDLGASDSEVASILHSLRSNLELSVERLLGR